MDDLWSRIRWWTGAAEEIAGCLGGRARAWCGECELFLDDFWSGRRVCWRLRHGLVEACFGFGAAACREQRSRGQHEKNHCLF